MARALTSLTLVAVFAAVVFSGVALAAATKVAPLDQVSSNTLASGGFELVLAMQHSKNAAEERNLPKLAQQLAELTGDARANLLEVTAMGGDRVRVTGAGHQRRMAMALVGLALRRAAVRERLSIAAVEVQGAAIELVAARRSFDAQNSNTTTAAPATTTAAATTSAPMMTNSSNGSMTTAAAATTSAPTPPPSTLPAAVVAAISATIRIAGTAFAALLNGTPAQRTQLFNAVAADLGTLLGIDAAFIYITNMYLGSLVVEFSVDAAAGVAPTVLTTRLSKATESSSWLSSTQSVYSTVSNETLAVTEAPVVTATAPTTTAAPGSISPAAFVATVTATVAAVAAAVVAL